MRRFVVSLCLMVLTLAAVVASPLTAQAQQVEGDLNMDGVDAGDLFTVPDMQPSGEIGTNTTVGGTGGGNAELALTGTDVEPIVATSLGLLALGGSVLVTSRRRLRNRP